jgi:hypothetical protein
MIGLLDLVSTCKIKLCCAGEDQTRVCCKEGTTCTSAQSAWVIEMLKYSETILILLKCPFLSSADFALPRGQSKIQGPLQELAKRLSNRGTVPTVTHRSLTRLGCLRSLKPLSFGQGATCFPEVDARVGRYFLGASLIERLLFDASFRRASHGPSSQGLPQ